MKLGTVIDDTQSIPEELNTQILQKFPNHPLSDLLIRYFDTVEDLGYEYFINIVLPTCANARAVKYLEPFISFTRLGEALVLENFQTAFVYDATNGDRCTETGPFWLVTLKSYPLGKTDN